jgi:hypothetical protein
MRILVTKLGDEFVKEISEEFNETLKQKKFLETIEQQTKKILNQTNKVRSNSTSSHKSPKSPKSPRSSKNVSITKNNNKGKNFKNESLRSSQVKYDQESGVINEDNLLNAKKIDIKQKRLPIPKNLTEKYNSDNRIGYILPDLTITKKINPSNLWMMNSKNMGYSYKNNLTTPFEKPNEYTFRDIINENAYFNLKTKLKREKKNKDSLSRIDETKFRSVYGELDRNAKLEDILDKTINANKITLIKYINQKEKISDNFLNKISESDNDKIIKANKVCQIVFFDKEKNQQLQERIKENIIDKKNKDMIEYKINIEKMGENLKDFSSIIKDYNNNNKNRLSKYRDIHQDTINKYWKRYNVENMMNKTIKDRYKSHTRRDSIVSTMSKTLGSFGYC